MAKLRPGKLGRLFQTTLTIFAIAIIIAVFWHFAERCPAERNYVSGGLERRVKKKRHASHDRNPSHSNDWASEWPYATDAEFWRISSEVPGIYHFGAGGGIGYDSIAAMEDTTTWGIGLNAAAEPYGAWATFQGTARLGFRDAPLRDKNLPAKRVRSFVAFPAGYSTSSMVNRLYSRAFAGALLGEDPIFYITKTQFVRKGRPVPKNVPAQPHKKVAKDKIAKPKVIVPEEPPVRSPYRPNG